MQLPSFARCELGHIRVPFYALNNSHATFLLKPMALPVVIRSCSDLASVFKQYEKFCARILAVNLIAYSEGFLQHVGTQRSSIMYTFNYCWYM